MIDVDKAVLKVEEMAELLGISRTTAYSLVHQKGFPVLRIGQRLIIPTLALKDWMKDSVERGVCL